MKCLASFLIIEMTPVIYSATKKALSFPQLAAAHRVIEATVDVAAARRLAETATRLPAWFDQGRFSGQVLLVLPFREAILRKR